MNNKPQRMCVACRSRDEKRALIRIVRTPEGKVSVDLSGKENGRGAYICLNKECIVKSKKTNALGRALKCEIDEDIYSLLESKCDNGTC